jgi:molybdate transport system ATP-binding protein
VRLKNVDLKRQGRRVLENVSWTLRPGEHWVLAGGNGAGKTQLLKLVSGAVWPTPSARPSRQYVWRGEIWRSPFEVKEEIAYLGPERQDKYERYSWNHSAARVVGTGLYRTDIPLNSLTRAEREQARGLLDRFGIAHLATRGFLSLSYGERRLTLLARALASEPKLLLLDELLNGLDEINRRRALQWLERTARSRLPWVLATHRFEDVPRSASHALVLDKGRVVYAGPLRGAPVRRWLASAGQESRSRCGAGPVSARATQPALVRLTNGSVFLEYRPVLQRLSFQVRAGECWVVHGRNGAGKTTLLRTLYGDHGVAVGGRIERAGIAAGVPIEVFKRSVGLIAPHLHADHSQELTATEVVQSGRYASVGLNDPPTASDRAAARRALAFFGATEFARRQVGELSYGQLRRVLFARAWVARPVLLLLDEPFSGVDAPTRRDLLEQITRLVARGVAVVMATHHRAEWPGCVTHELELVHGRARYCGPVR